MNIGLYQSAASLSALERWQEVTAQNITASQTTGYRKRTVEFSGVAMGEVQPDPRNGKIGNGDGPQSIFPKAGYGVNFEVGENHPTQNPLDLAIEGEGFFEVKLPDDTHAYTRAGQFRLSPDRTLTTSEGYPVLSESGTPVTLVPGAGELTISQDGTLGQGTTQIGKLSVQKFARTDRLMPISGGFFVAQPGSTPVKAENSIVMQGYLEGSNVTPMHEMIALVQIARAYEANQKIITTQDQTLGKALETLG